MEATQILMPFLALPYIIKIVGTVNYGKIAFANSICAYWMLFVNFGLDFLGTKEIAVNRDNRKKCGDILGVVLTIKILIFLIGFLLFSALILSWSKTKNDIWVYYFSYGICITEILFNHWLFQGLEKMFLITVVKSSSLVIYVCLLFLFLKRKNDYPLVPLLQNLSLVITSLIGLFYIVKFEKIKPSFPSVRYVLRFAKDSFPFFLSRVSNVFNNTMATVLIGILFNEYSVAVYDLGCKIVKATYVPAYMLTQAVYPHNVRNRDKTFSRKIFTFLLIVTVVGLSALYFIAPFLVNLLSHGELPESVRVIRLMIFYVFLGTISIYLGTPTLVSWGFPKPFNRSVFISTLALGIAYLFIYLFKCDSLWIFCYAVTFGEFIVMSYRLFYCIKYKIL